MPDPAVSAQLALARGGGGGVRSVADALGPGALAWSQGGWGSVYSAGASLPRATQTFQDGQFGPLAPLQPYPIDLGQPPSGRPRPRRWQYPVGWNILTGQPGTEGVMLANFQVCEDYAEQPTIPRHIIEKCKCLDPDTLVEMADGTLRAASTITTGMWLSTGGVLASQSMGLMDQVEVRLSDGRVLRTTTDHPFMISGGEWVWAEHLRPGVRLVAPERLSNAEMSEPDELFLLLGYLIGDGSTRDNGVNFTGMDQAVWDRFTHCVKVMGGDLGWQADAGRAWTRGVRGLSWVVRAHGLHGVTARQKRIPDVVWRASHRQRLLFLTALWECDGHWRGVKPGRAFYLATASERLARDVHLMLRQMSIQATHRTHIGGAHRDWTYHRVNLASRDWAVAAEWPWVLDRRRPTASERPLDAPPTVESVTPIGAQPTWGLTVSSGVHVTEGVLTHNTAILNLIGDDLSENIVPTGIAEKAMQGNPGKRKDWESRKSEVLDFFRDPDPDGHTDGFGDWLSAILEDNLVIDAVAIHVQPTFKKKSGPCDSNLGALALLSGDTIKPLLTLNGGRPRPPQTAYQSVMWGVPRVDLMDLLADFGPETSIDDLNALNPVLDDLLDNADQFAADQLLYVVQNRRNRTPYGFSPMAQALLAASILIARQTWQFEFFQSGSLPTVFLDPGESVATAEEARQLQEAINMLGGDLGARHQVIVLPPGAKVQDQKPIDLTSQLDEWLAALLCMPFGLSISDLGLTPKIGALMSPQASRGAAQMASDRSTEASVIPRAKALKERLFDRIIQRHLGQPDMMWSWGIEEGGESLKDKIEQGLNQVKSSVISIDEFRIDQKREPFGEPWSSVPLAFTAAGVVPLGSPASDALASGEPTPKDQAAMEAKKPPPLPPGGPAAAGRGNGKTPPKKPASGNGSSSRPTSAPVSDSHAAARQVDSASKPGGNGSSTTGRTAPNQKAAATPVAAVVAECEILRRFLKKGKPLDTFVPKSLTPGVLAVGKGYSTPEAIVWAVTKAAKRRARRDVAVNPISQRVGSAIGSLGNQVAAGSLAPAAFVTSSAGVLADGYGDAYGAGSGHAAEDLGGDAEDDWDNEAAGRADAQRPFLTDFAAAIALGLSAADIADRADLYGDTMTGAYEEGYGTTAAASLDSPTITWHLGDADHCALCEDRDGEEYTPDELPGWPGDGDFGEVCEGGPRCACWLEYTEASGGGSPDDTATADDTIDTATTDTPSGARATDLGPATAEEADAQMAGFEDVTTKTFARVYDSSTNTYVQVPRIDVAAPAAPKLTKAFLAEVTKAIHKAGNPDALRDWYNDGAGGAIDWGSPGDFDACVEIASAYMDADQAAGFCNLRHQDAVGGAPGSEDKNFGLSGPSGVSFTPFDLAGPAGQRAPNSVGQRRVRGRRSPKDFAEAVASFATPLEAAEAFAKGLWDEAEHEVRGRDIVVKRSGTWHNGDGLSPDASEDQLQEHLLSDHAPRVDLHDVPAGGRDAMDRFHASLHSEHGEIGAHRLPTWADKATTGTEAWQRAQDHPGVGGGAGPVFDHPAALVQVEVFAAGLAVRAEDTGRVLMLQRALSDGPDVASGKTDPAAGKWEFPGGKLEARETPWEAAVREWQEETGLTLPVGRVVNNWRSPNGVYEGFVYSVGAEDMLPINDPAHAAVINPDDPDGDITETLAWWNPDDIPSNPGVRAEVLEGTDWRALRTPTMLTAKLGKEEVHYRPALDVAMRCGNCSMFLPEGLCTLVDGPIDSAAVCDQWDPKDGGVRKTWEPPSPPPDIDQHVPVV